MELHSNEDHIDKDQWTNMIGVLNAGFWGGYYKNVNVPATRGFSSIRLSGGDDDESILSVWTLTVCFLMIYSLQMMIDVVSFVNVSLEYWT